MEYSESIADIFPIIDREIRGKYRKICANEHGPFPNHWVVHHINFDRNNNRPENLIAMPPMLHNYIHHEMRLSGVKMNRKEIEDKLNKFLSFSREFGLRQDRAWWYKKPFKKFRDVRL